ncbi:unnamed protein product [Phytophthora fragariaefolia]|uniref:Unnamed protein product n=1 Tax=Phytophthora fragariaefolia TaxID=1490495 RepID=A0A9W6YD58_9STRA|nr:unnamed protein product [Phytophthora fragariaefolia]
MAGSGSRKKEGRRQLAEAEPSRHAAKEANEVLAQEGVTSGSAVQDAHQVSKSGDQERAPEGADVSMSADSKLGPDDEDKSVPDASAQASVGGADVVEPPVGGRVSDSAQPEHEVEASDDDEGKYVETKKPQFGPAEDVEVVEVGSDPDDDDDEVELMKVEPAVRKETHHSTVQEDQVLEDMEVASLKSSGTASIRTPVQARSSPVLSAEVQVKAFVTDQVRRWERGVSESSFPPNIKYDWPHDHLDSSSDLSAVLTTSEYLRKRTSMAAEADALITEMELTRRSFGAPGDWTAVAIPVVHFSPREFVAVLQTQLFEAGFGFLNLDPGWFRTRANKAHPDLVHNVVEEMLILLTIETVELRQPLVRAVEIQVSARAEQPRPEGIVLEPDVEMSDRETGPKRTQRVPALAPPSSIPTSPQSVSSSAFRSLEGARPGSMSSGPESSVKSESQATSSLFGTMGGSNESLRSVTSGSQTSRDSSSGSSGFSWGRDAGGHMSAVPMAMTARTLGGDTAVGPAIAMYATQETLPSNPVQADQADAAMSESSRSQARGRKSKSSRRRSKRTSPSPSGSSSSEERHRRLGSDQDSDRSNGSSFEDVVPNVPTVAGPGGTMFTFRPYVNASALEDFDEKASLAVRTRWLERFQSIAVQGGWTDKVMIYEMKLKLSAAVRNWRANLRPKVRRDWKKFLKEFREMYCKAKTSDSE